MDIAEKIEENLLGRFSYIPKLLDGMEVTENAGLTLINSHLRTDMFNIVCARASVDDRQIKNIIAKYATEGLPFAWWFGFEGQEDSLASLLIQNGFAQTEEELAMALKADELVIPKSIKHLKIQAVNTLESLLAFVSVFSELLPDESEAIQRYFDKSSSLLLSKHFPLKLFVGYLDGELVSTASLFFNDDTAGIYDVITLPKHRGKGVAKAMTAFAAQEAFKEGAVYSILTATDDAKFVYEKLGFKVVKMLSVYNLKMKQ